MSQSTLAIVSAPLRIAYGLYVWLEFIVVLLCTVFVALFIPGLHRRRRWVARFGRLSLRLAGIRTTVRGLENLPDGHCVVIANHASYVDAVILQGFLPDRFSFVIKGEMQRFPIVGFMLRRVGSRFVERFDASGSARDARELLRAASDGESLAVFPEGTFIAEPGLGRFRRGAISAAMRASVPLVPVVISGTRYVLPADRWLPRYGHLRLDILRPIDASDPAWNDVHQLIALTRQRMLETLDEPDLVKDAAGAGTPVNQSIAGQQ